MNSTASERQPSNPDLRLTPAGGVQADPSLGYAPSTKTAPRDGADARRMDGLRPQVALHGAHPPVARIVELTPLPGAGTPGSTLRIIGTVVPPGPVGLSVYWEQSGNLRLVSRERPTAMGPSPFP